MTPQDIPTLSLNTVEEWEAIDVIGRGCTRRTTKHSHKFSKNTRKTTFHMEHFNQQSPKRGLNKRGRQEYSP